MARKLSEKVLCARVLQGFYFPQFALLTQSFATQREIEITSWPSDVILLMSVPQRTAADSPRRLTMGSAVTCKLVLMCRRWAEVGTIQKGTKDSLRNASRRNDMKRRLHKCLQLVGCQAARAFFSDKSRVQHVCTACAARVHHVCTTCAPVFYGNI